LSPGDFDCQCRAQWLTVAGVKFSIARPGFRNSNRLKLRTASVADPQAIELEPLHSTPLACNPDARKVQGWL